jgi:type VI secretion system protein ImpH
MAGQDGRAPRALDALQQLRQEPHRFSLFAALRVLERQEPDRPRIGDARRPDDERVRVEQPPHLTFAPCDVESVQAASGGRLRVAQLGFGIFGPNGALPTHLTEYAFERRRHHEDAAVSDFVNLFQHRLATLFYRAWAESDPTTSHARADDDDFAQYLGALIGLADTAAAGRDSVPDAAKWSRVASLGRASRCADGLESLLADYLGQPVEVRQFVAGWLQVPLELRTRIGVADGYAELGRSATLGAASWQCQCRFEVVVGPLSFEDFLQYLPGSRALRALGDLVRLYTTGEWSWRVRLLVRRGDVPGIELGRIGRLGWTSWLGRRQGDASDVVFQEGQVAAA